MIKYSDSYLKYISLFIEYNHFLINTNYAIKNLSSNDRLINLVLFDEGITNYLGFLLLNVYPNPGNLLNDTNIQFDENFAKKQTKKYIDQNISNFELIHKGTFKKLNELFNRTIIEFSEEEYKFLITFFDIVLMYYILENYGLKKIYELIFYLYNTNYSSLDDITKPIFNTSFIKFIEKIKLYYLSLN